MKVFLRCTLTVFSYAAITLAALLTIGCCGLASITDEQVEVLSASDFTALLGAAWLLHQYKEKKDAG